MIPRTLRLLPALALAATVLAADTGSEAVLRLLPAAATTHGQSVRVELHGGIDNLGHWGPAGDTVRWQVAIPAAGTWTVQAEVAAPAGESTLMVRIGDQTASATVPRTSAWQHYRTVTLGTVTLSPGDALPVVVGAADPATWQPVNLRAVILSRRP